MTDTERRRFQRIILHRPVSLVIDGRTYPGELIDISLHGALMRAEGEETPPPGARGIADIGLGDDPEFVIRMPVTVRHLQERLIGLETGQLEIEDASRLKRLVELNVADPALLQRELEELSRV